MCAAACPWQLVVCSWAAMFPTGLVIMHSSGTRARAHTRERVLARTVFPSEPFVPTRKVIVSTLRRKVATVVAV